MAGLFTELKRRHVFKVSIAYIVVAWLILQVADVVLNNIAAPGWVFHVILLLLAIGFPLIVMFAWAYDLTPDGFRRTDPIAEAAAGDAASTAGTEASVAPVAPAKASVAVLPFVNMSGDKENEYFSDGLSEELLNALTQVNSLKVAARTSSFHFKGQTGDIAQIAQNLGVASVLEGSVRQAGARVRITAQLVNAADGYHLWSKTFDRELDDIFAVQDEIASSVVKALKVKLLGEDTLHLSPGGTTNAEALQAYLQGVHYRNRGSDESALQNAAAAFQKAIELDPEYAQAYAGLGLAWDNLATNNFVGLDQVTSKVGAAAEKAIELAPDLADGYHVLGGMLLRFKLDQEGARKAITKALELNPGNVDVQTEYSRICSLFGDHEASVAAARTALELDPVSMSANQFMGYVLSFAREYDEAIRVFRHSLELDPHYPRPHYGIAMCQYLQGDPDSALKELEQEPLLWMKYSGMAIVLRRLGRDEEAVSSMSSLIENFRDNGLYQQAQVHAQWSDIDQAIKTLNRARDIGDPGVSQILVDPLLDPIRGDPRFDELAKSIGFTAA